MTSSHTSILPKYSQEFTTQNNWRGLRRYWRGISQLQKRILVYIFGLMMVCLFYIDIAPRVRTELLDNSQQNDVEVNSDAKDKDSIDDASNVQNKSANDVIGEYINKKGSFKRKKKSKVKRKGMGKIHSKIKNNIAKNAKENDVEEVKDDERNEKEFNIVQRMAYDKYEKEAEEFNAKKEIDDKSYNKKLPLKLKLKNNEELPPEDGSIVFKGAHNDRQRAVVESFRHAWKGYKTYAWGKDHLKPISQSHDTWFNLGLTLIDSLDTMLIMNLKAEFDEAREWVDKKLDLNIDKDVNLFETTIRVLGGLLSTFHLTGDKMFLKKSVDLGDRLLGAFASSSAIPYSDVNLKTLKAHDPDWGPDSSTSEVTTIQVEFKDLSKVTGDTKYSDAVTKVTEHVHGLKKDNGLVPIWINSHSGQFREGSTITLGARGDSHYEYLLKQWLQTGETEDDLKTDYLQFVEGVLKKLVGRSKPNNLLFIGELLNGRDFNAKMDELVCFLPGTLALGVHSGLPSSHLTLAEDLLHTCYLTFSKQPTHLAPEITHFLTQDCSGLSCKDFYVKPADTHYLLRPETVESLFYMYYLTGNTTYQDWGWEIFQGIEEYAKVRDGYTAIGNVKDVSNTRPRDKMESFFLGETLKYLYLLFADSDQHEIDLDQWLFNTEAHLMPIYQK